MSVTYRLLGGVAACALAIAPGAVRAQTQGQIDQLQRQIQQLQTQLQTLQEQVTSQSQRQQQFEKQQTETAANPGPHVVQPGTGGRLGLESSDGQYSIALTGRLHFDAGDYLDFHPQAGSATKGLQSGVNARRARLGVVGKFAGDWNYAFIYDAGGSVDGFAGIENAYVTYNGIRKANPAIAIDIGYMDTPYTLDEATSSNNIMFMERASSQTIATAFGAGDNRSALGVRAFDNRWWAGLYLTGPTSGAFGGGTHTTATNEQYGAFGRFTYQLLQESDYSLHVGVDALGAIHPGGAPRAIALTDRPELRIDSTALFGATIGTAPATNPVTGGSVFSGELAGNYGPLFLQGEYFHYTVDRQNLSENHFDGGYMQASYTLTGEAHKYDVTSGAYGGINPAHPFSLSAGHWGAFELAARFSQTNLNDALGQANAFQAGRETVYAFGLNWYANPNVRFMFDYLHGEVKKNFSPGTVPAGGSAGNFDALAMRTQVAF